MKELKEVLKDYIGWQIYFTRNVAGDYLEVIYNNEDNGIRVERCDNYKYLEIFGLTKKQQKQLENCLGSLHVLENLIK